MRENLGSRKDSMALSGYYVGYGNPSQCQKPHNNNNISELSSPPQSPVNAKVYIGQN